MKEYSLLHEEAKGHIDDLIEMVITGIYEDIAPIDGEVEEDSSEEEDEYELFFKEGIDYFKEKVKKL
jgi:hypothetical protein